MNNKKLKILTPYVQVFLGELQNEYKIIINKYESEDKGLSLSKSVLFIFLWMIEAFGI